MAVFRVKKNENFTTMCNIHLRDKSLSLKAKGMLSIFLSLPAEWHYSVKGLAEICQEGPDCIRSVLKELESAGYLIRRRTRKENGQLGDAEYLIYETPQPKGDEDRTFAAAPVQEDPVQKPPMQENPAQVNPVQNDPTGIKKEEVITEQSMTDLLNTDQSKKERGESTRHKYGQYKNVLLSDGDLEKLKAEFPHILHIHGDHVIRHDILRIVKPEAGHLGQHRSFFCDLVLQNNVKGGDAVCRHHDQRVADIIDLSDFSFFKRLVFLHCSPPCTVSDQYSPRASISRLCLIVTSYNKMFCFDSIPFHEDTDSSHNFLALAY